MERLVRRRRRTAGEGGFTLIEVLVTVAISSAIVVPILTWIVIGFRVENNAVQGAKLAQGASLLNAYLPSDVANSAEGSNAAIIDCSGGEATAGIPVLGLDDVDIDGPGGDPATRTVYVVWSEDAAGGEPYGLWRRRCDADTLALVDELRVIEELEPASGTVPAAVSVTCAPGASATNPCTEVTLSATTLAPNSHTLVARGVARAGAPR